MESLLDRLPEMGIMYLTLLFSLCVHEAAHAAASNWCGDPSARLMGRLTLNPLAHIDPLGTVVLPLLMMVSSVPFGIGWAKPVPFNPLNLRNMRRDPVIIAAAGPASNLLLAILFLFLSRLFLLVAPQLMTFSEESLSLAALFFLFMVCTNLSLAIFNLIPVPPLDGHHILHYFLPPAGQRVLEQIGPFGIIIALVTARPLFRLLDPLFDMMVRLTLNA